MMDEEKQLWRIKIGGGGREQNGRRGEQNGGGERANL